MYNASLAFTKFSILFQYLRIFPGRSFRIACHIMMAVVATYSSWAIVSGYVNCVPVAKFWNHDLPGSCLIFGWGRWWRGRGRASGSVVSLALRHLFS